MCIRDSTLSGGAGTFIITLKTAGNQTITATDTQNSDTTGTSTAVTVGAAAATHFAVTVPGSATAGTAVSITVTALDQFNNRATGYTGTVHFTLTGPAMAQADYTFTAADMGSHTFSGLVLSQAGDYTLTAMDSADPTDRGSVGFTIDLP